MKKLFPILFVLILTSCSKPEIPSHRLVENGGLFYEMDSNQPFSGSSVQYIDTKLFSKTYLNKGIMVKKETFYPEGTFHTIESFIEGKGGKKVQVFDKEGRDISDETYLTFWGNGLVKKRGDYIDGKRDGLWEEFDLLGNSIVRNYWRDNKLLPIINFEKIQLRENIPFLVNSTEPFSGIIRFTKSEYFGVQLQEFKLGKPEGIFEQRFLEEEGGQIEGFTSYTKGSSYDFEVKYISDVIPFYREGSYDYWFHKNGKKAWKSRVKDGLSSTTTYYENGQIKSKGQYRFYKDDSWLEEGTFIGYYENGQVKSEILFNKGVQGASKMFSKTGMDISNGEGRGEDLDSYPEGSGYYLDGLKEGKWISEDGDVVIYKRGIKEGAAVISLGKGCTWKTGSYKNDKKEGEWIEYDNCKEEGDRSETIYFENGKKVEK